jgi:hypothetical protein
VLGFKRHRSQPCSWPLLALIAGLLAGCSGSTNVLDYVTPGKVPDAPVLDPSLFPANYKAEMINYLRSTLTTRVRDAYIAQPVLKPMDKVPQYITCIRYSPLDVNNQPTGSTETKLAIFLGGSLMQYLPGDPQVCAGLTYQRFPELEALGPPKT